MTLKQYLLENSTIEGKKRVYIKYKDKLIFNDVTKLENYYYKLQIKDIIEFEKQKMIILVSECKHNN